MAAKKIDLLRDAPSAAEAAELTYVSITEPGYVRRGSKGKFFYVTPKGDRVTDERELDRIRKLGIPPAWQEVRIAAHPRAHIQAMGKDAAGRLQYIYHPDWETKRLARKQNQLKLLTTALPAVRRRVSRDLDAPAGSQELALAIAVALIDRTAMRVGREKYLKSSGTRGAGRAPTWRRCASSVTSGPRFIDDFSEAWTFGSSPAWDTPRRPLP